LAVLESLVAPPQPPAWFAAASTAVLDGAGVVLAAGGPGELEQATAELLGRQLRRVLREERQGLWFEWWFEELTGVLADRVRGELAGVGRGWQAPWRLLHGLTSVGSPGLASVARAALRGLAKDVAAAGRSDPAARPPAWLAVLPRVAATGEVWLLRDVYGARLGVIAGFCYPGGVDRSVFLFDIDACGLVELANAGVFEEVAQAAAGWRAMVGDTAAGAVPSPVEAADQLECLTQWDGGEVMLRGTESDAALDNWFRARRRVGDLAAALAKRGTPLPAARSLYRDRDTTPMIEAFTAWHAARHGSQPDPQGLDALATEWLEGCLPGTEHAASPHRVRYQQALIGDWIEDPVTAAAKALLPEWVRWNGEQAGLPEYLSQHAADVAAGCVHTTAHCGPADL
jgi:hypothetical protein